MSKYFDRRWEIIIGGIPFIQPTDGQEFKMTFEVMVDFGGYTSYADIAIYNLSGDTVDSIIKQGETIILRAGYVDNIDLIFQGTINNALKERGGDGTSIITRLIAKGGILSGRDAINLSLGKGTSVVSIIRSCVQAMGYEIVINEDDFSSVSPYSRGYAMNGDPRAILDSLAKTHKFNYTFEGARVVVVGNNSFRIGSPVEVSQFTGMIGIPEITEVGADVVKQLDPNVKVGGRIDIQSELSTFNFSNLYFQDIPPSAGKGIYRVFKTQHSGDTKGDVWATKITGIR